MQIIKTKRFNDELLQIYDFIAQDSIPRADKFRNELENSLENLSNFPKKYRKSIKSDDESIRDLIFKEYVVPYKIYENEIFILGIFAHNKWLLKE